MNKFYFLNWQDASHQDIQKHQNPYTVIGCRRDNEKVIKALKKLPQDALVVCGSLETQQLYAIVAITGTIKKNGVLVADIVWPNDEYHATCYTALLKMGKAPITLTHKTTITTTGGKKRGPYKKNVIGVPVVGGNQTLFTIEESQFIEMRDSIGSQKAQIDKMDKLFDLEEEILEEETPQQ